MDRWDEKENEEKRGVKTFYSESNILQLQFKKKEFEFQKWRNDLVILFDNVLSNLYLISKPHIVIAHILFRGSALVVYILANMFSTSFIIQFLLLVSKIDL